MKDLIYVQIAAYRDPELLKTVRECFNLAKHPEKIQMCIAWQHAQEDTWDTLAEFQDHPQVTIIDIDYKDARGVCWARHKLNKEYRGQKYTLQLDSHHRFTQDWDAELKKMFKGLVKQGFKKPLITAYLPSYDPNNDPGSRITTPWNTDFDRFSPDGNVHFQPNSIDDWRDRPHPIPARFVSGHFLFTLGKFCKEVEYDSSYYFHGEEINLSVRAYLAGYDLFHPNKVIMWHEYTRSNKKKHWDDHTNWNALNDFSHAHNRQMLGIDGVVQPRVTGNARQLEDYERYAGLQFSTRRVHTKTIEKKYPPICTADDPTFEEGLRSFRRYCIDLYKGAFTETDYTVWVLAFKDADGNEIYREDVSPDEIKRLMAEIPDDKFVHVWRTFFSSALPTKYIVWPATTSKGWLPIIEGSLVIDK